jgi:hypothetical protein
VCGDGWGVLTVIKKRPHAISHLLERFRTSKPQSGMKKRFKRSQKLKKAVAPNSCQRYHGTLLSLLVEYKDFREQLDNG